MEHAPTMDDVSDDDDAVVYHEKVNPDEGYLQVDKATPQVDESAEEGYIDVAEADPMKDEYIDVEDADDEDADESYLRVERAEDVQDVIATDQTEGDDGAKLKDEYVDVY